MTKKARIFTSAYDKINSIEYASELEKEQLIITEYYTILDILSIMEDLKSPAYCFMAGVAKWFSRNGFTVKQAGVNYKISIE